MCRPSLSNGSIKPWEGWLWQIWLCLWQCHKHRPFCHKKTPEIAKSLWQKRVCLWHCHKHTLFCHKDFAAEAATAADLVLCGHTHGGQFNALGLTPYSIGFERLYGRRIAPLGVAGWQDADGARLLVSKGIGASRIPLRIGVRPEIELLCFE